MEKKRALKCLEQAQRLVDKQAKDEGLWFLAETAPEAYLQRALRELHATIEGQASQQQIGQICLSTLGKASQDGD